MSTVDTETPYRCPFCGHIKVKVNPHRTGYCYTDPRKYRVHCNKCHCNGPLCATEEEAVERWNNMFTTKYIMKTRNEMVNGYCNKLN